MPPLATIAPILASVATIAGTIGSTIAAGDRGSKNDEAIDIQRKSADTLSNYINSGPVGNLGLGSNTTGGTTLPSNTLGRNTLSGASPMMSNTPRQRPSTPAFGMGA